MNYAASPQGATQIPTTRRAEVRETLHGTEVVDPYRWLEDQDSPETRAWIDAQNAATRAILDPLPVRAVLEERLGKLMRLTVRSLPILRAGHYYYMSRAADQELGVICRRKGLRGKEQVLVDPHGLSPDHTVSVSLLDVSRDGEWMAYALRRGGADEVEVRLLDTRTVKDVPISLPTARYFSVTLAPDRSHIYYVRHDENGPRLFRRDLRQPESLPELLFGEGYGGDKIISCELSEDGRYLVMVVWYGSAAQKTEVWVLDLRRGGPPTPIVTDLESRFHGSIGGDTLFLQTDWRAPRGRILAVDLDRPQRENWREIAPEQADALQSFALAGKRVYAHYLRDLASHIRVFAPDGTDLGALKLPGIGSADIAGEWGMNEAFISYSSFTVPDSIYRLEASRGTLSLWYKTEAPIRSGDYVVRVVTYASKDGTRIPMFLVHRKGLKKDGNRPAHLTGYGGFSTSTTPYFSLQATLFADAGGIFATPALRGGGEFGEEWHRAGMLEKKQNVFDDFIAAAEWLIAEGYTRPERLTISGGSNGGLLVGAALTQRPDLFRAVLCAVPLLDMLRYHLFLVARFWVPEYGSAEDPEQFRYLLRYSPYHNVREGVIYPAVLFSTGDSDTRVAPLHARKMCALLQHVNPPDRPVLLDYDTASGHAGGKPLSERIKEFAREMAFLFWQIGADLK